MSAGAGDSDASADLATVSGEWYDMFFCAAPTAEDDGDAVPHAEYGEDEGGVFGGGTGDMDFDFDVDLYALVTSPARTLVTNHSATRRHDCRTLCATHARTNPTPPTFPKRAGALSRP